MRRPTVRAPDLAAIGVVEHGRRQNLNIEMRGKFVFRVKPWFKPRHAALLEKIGDLPGFHILRHGHHPQPLGGQLVELRQFGDTGRAPGCPEVEQHRLASEILERQTRIGCIVEHQFGHLAAFVRAVDLSWFRGSGSAGCRCRLRLVGLLPIAACGQEVQAETKDSAVEQSGRQQGRLQSDVGRTVRRRAVGDHA
jgi:hypothetical protein